MSSDAKRASNARYLAKFKTFLFVLRKQTPWQCSPRQIPPGKV